MNLVLYLVTCDDSATTGEGVLAGTITDLLGENGVKVISTDLGLESFIRRLPFRLSRVIYLIKFIQALYLKCCRKRNVLYLNYVPLWNPMISLLALSGVRLGPITGSVGVLSLNPTYPEIFLRRYVQNALVALTLSFLPKNQVYWAATPSVWKRMKPKFNATCLNGYPFLLSSQLFKLPRNWEEKPTEYKYDFFIYSKPHVLKNFDFTVSLARNLACMGFKVVFIGSALEAHPNLSSHGQLPPKMFDQSLASSRAYLHLTSEDAGIACMKAMSLGKEIYYVKGTPGECLISDRSGFPVRFDPDISVFAKRVMRHYIHGSCNQQVRSGVHFNELNSRAQEAASKWVLHLT